MRLPRIQFNRYSPFSLNGHFYKTVISLNWTPGVGPAVPQSLFWLSIKADKILKCWSPQCWVILDVKLVKFFFVFWLLFSLALLCWLLTGFFVLIVLRHSWGTRVLIPSMSRSVRPKTQKRTMPNTWIQYIINLFHTSDLLIYSFIQTQRMEINYIHDNQPFWPCLKVRILLYFAHDNEVRKAYYHANNRIR